MLSLCLAVVLTQAPTGQGEGLPADAPVAVPSPSLVPGPEPVPASPSAVRQNDARSTTRILLTGGAALAGSGAALGIVYAFTGIRERIASSGAKFDAVFGTAALGAIMVAGVGLAVHQAMGGKGEAALAMLASVACMLTTMLVVNALPLDDLGRSIAVASIGGVTGAVSVTAILEATTGLDRSVR